MENLSDYLSPVIEFKSKHRFRTEQCNKMVDKSTEIDLSPKKLADAAVSTSLKCSQETQTENPKLVYSATPESEHKLLLWLRKIYPVVDKELAKGCTPVLPTPTYNAAETLKIRPYQKISLEGDENSTLLITWLALHISNMPCLILCLVPPHNGWCDHFEQAVKLYIPQRTPNGKFIAYDEEKSQGIIVNSCLRSLCTNSFNKDMFAGSTYAGDIYVWQLEHKFRHNKTLISIKEVCKATSPHDMDMAVDMDWLEENCLLTAHSNAYIVRWQLMAKTMTQQTSYRIQHSVYSKDEISNLLTVGLDNFVVGTKNDLVLHCWIPDASTKMMPLKIKPLKKHAFAVTSLLKYHRRGDVTVVSCDLSGQIYYHDVKSMDSNIKMIFHLPLPFKNAIACSNEGDIIFYPEEDGSLGYCNIKTGYTSTVQSGLTGKGNAIKRSENGISASWIATGPFKTDVQIFSVEFDE